MGGTRLVQRWSYWLWTAAAGVLVWRALGVWFPHSASSDPELVRGLAALMGLWFMAWGLWAFRAAGDVPSLLFAGYGITSGMHWGGPVGLGSPSAQNLLLALYVVVSSVLTQSLFLHLALAFPPAYGRSGRRAGLLAVYFPVLAATLLLAVLAVRPSSQGLLRYFYVFLPIAVLYSLVGGGVWIHRLVTADPTSRRSRRLPLVVGAMVLAWLPHAVASASVDAGSLLAGLLNLPFALVPPALAWALARPRPAAASPDPAGSPGAA
jgi:hypothetical protein